MIIRGVFHQQLISLFYPRIRGTYLEVFMHVPRDNTRPDARDVLAVQSCFPDRPLGTRSRSSGRLRDPQTARQSSLDP